jgi:O-antigen ligase
MIASIRKEHIIAFSILLIFIGLILSPFLMSLGMGLIVFCSIVIKSDTGFHFNKNILIDFLKKPDFWFITGVFFIVLIGYFNTENIDYWLERLRIKLPFLILPIAIAGFAPLSENVYKNLIKIMVIFLFLVCTGELIFYILNFSKVNDLLGHGHPFPTPREHIRFSLVLSFTIILSGWLFVVSKSENGVVSRTKKHRWFWGLTTIFLTIMLHLMAIRSGIMVFYLGLIFILFWTFIYKPKNRALVIGLFLGMLLLPIIAVNVLPSLKTKYGYSRLDYQTYNSKDAHNYSDAGRWYSFKASLDIFKTSPLLGVGVGDVQDKVKEYYKQHYPVSSEPKLPHNQFLYVLTGSGILGLIVFIISLYFPLWVNRSKFWFVLFYIMATGSFLVEYTLDSQAGVAYFWVFLTLIFLKPNSKNQA